jgi:hypothetical protein
MIGEIVFMIGVILIALALTYFPLTPLLLAGIILAGGGVAFSRLFREF